MSVCLCVWLNQSLSKHFLFCYVVSKANEDELIESLGFAVFLKILHCCRQVFYTEEDTHCNKTFFDKQGTIVGNMFVEMPY